MSRISSSTLLQLILKKCFFPFINAEIVTKFLTLAGSTIFDAFAVFQFYHLDGKNSFVL